MKKIPTKLINEEDLNLMDTDSTKVDTKPVGNQDPKQVDQTTPVKAEGGEATPPSKEEPALLTAKDAGETTTIADGPQDAPIVESVKFVIYEGLPRAVISETDEKVELLYDTETGEKKTVEKSECKESWKPKTAKTLKESKNKASLKEMFKNRIVEIVSSVSVLTETAKVLLEKKDFIVVLEEAEGDEPEIEKKEETEDDTKEVKADKKEESFMGKKIFKVSEDSMISETKMLEKGDKFVVLSEEDFNKPIDKKEAEMWKDPVEVKLEMPDVKGLKESEEEKPVEEELTDKQKKLDVDGDGKIEGEDLAKLRAGKKAEESEEIETPADEKKEEAEDLTNNEPAPQDDEGKSKDAQAVAESEEEKDDSEKKKDDKVQEKVYTLTEDKTISGKLYKAGTKFVLVK